jgi:ubiquinone/menaquinone biosynthesis C-methylase UbiE
MEAHMRRPHFIAEQARHATGLLGRIVAFIMARETWAENQRAIDALDIQPTDHILDIGCGHGRSLGELAARAPHGCAVGADPSDLMVQIAVDRNRALVKARRAKVVVATAGDLPFADAAFDKALCVHVLYFWKDLHSSFQEMARVLKPGAKLALVFRSTQHADAVQSFPSDVYRFPEFAEVEAMLAEVGFSVAPAPEPGGDVRAHLLIATRLP